ncbi:MAG: response regulator transcription factor [Chloroflexi bacterium]|nr:MAG: response regulator transcription factor [Chloroflexota bacterium]
MQVVPRTLGRAPILVVDDDPKIVHLVRMYLEREGFDVVAAADGVSAIAAIRERAPRLLVLDVMLPGLDGFSVLRAARVDSDVPVLILSARGSTADRISGIASGADDYLPKPFSPGELVVRVKALLRRAGVSAPRDEEKLALGDLTVDRDRHEVRRAGERIAVTGSDLRLLTALIEARGRIVSREALLDALYGDGESEILDRTIDVYIRRLREKLGDDPEQPRYIATVRGAGYRAVIER